MMGWFDGKPGGLLGNFGDNNQGMGILGGASVKPSGMDIASLISATLSDGYAGYRGKQGTAVDSAVQGMEGNNVRRSLIAGLQSQDPAERQKAYALAPLYGVDPKSFQQQQATSQLPAFLNSMKPQQATLNSQSAPLPSGGNITTAPINFEAPGLSVNDAIMQAPPELQGQYAPKLIEQQMAADKPFDLTPGQVRFGANGEQIASLPGKPEATPDSIQIAQTLFPNDPKAQHDYLVKNSPSNLRSISNYNAPKENWQVLTDPKAGTQYRYDVNSGRAFTFDGKPYIPQGAAKIAGGSPRSPAMVYMGKFLEEHPNASVDEVQTAANKFRTGQSEAGTIGTRSGAADVASQEVSVFAKQARDASSALPRTEYAALNSALQSWDMKTSNPNLRKLMIASDALVNARARAISPTGSPHVNDQLEGRKMLSAAFAKGDFEAAVDMMAQEAEGVRSSTKASKDEFFGNKPPPAPAALPRLPGKAKTIRFEDMK